jgi:molybdopterin-guanine dinucleotide biosynthesis protein A
MPRWDDLSAIVLAGGRSRRFKSDKALLVWGGEPMIVRLVRLLKPEFATVLVVTGPTRRYTAILDVPILEDAVKGKGPLGGIYTGLLASPTEDNLVLACDMPLLDLRVVSLLERERDGCEAVVAEVNGHLEPLLGIYKKSCLARIARSLEQGALAVHDLLASLQTRVIPEARIRAVDPELRSFANVNTQEELDLWRRQEGGERERDLDYMPLLRSGV